MSAKDVVPGDVVVCSVTETPLCLHDDTVSNAYFGYYVCGYTTRGTVFLIVSNIDLDLANLALTHTGCFIDLAFFRKLQF